MCAEPSVATHRDASSLFVSLPFFPPSSLPLCVSFYSRLSFLAFPTDARRFQRFFDDEDVWWFRYGRRGKYPCHPLCSPRPPLPFVFFTRPSRDCLRRSAETGRQFSVYFRGSCSLCRELGFEARTVLEFREF